MTATIARLDLLADLITDHARHTANAKAHLADATTPAEGDEDEANDTLTPAEHLAAAGVEAQLANAAASAAAALAAIIGVQPGT